MNREGKNEKFLTFDSLVNVGLVTLLDLANDLLGGWVDGRESLPGHGRDEFIVDKNLQEKWWQFEVFRDYVTMGQL